MHINKKNMRLEVSLVDFSFSDLVDNEQNVTLWISDFAAPEVKTDMERVDRVKTEVFSIGAVIF